MLVEIKNLVKRYGSNLAVDNVSLTIKEGEIFGLLGPNGAGKTSLIHSLLGITPMTSGQVIVFGKDFATNENEIKSQVGIVPQEIAIYDDLTAAENVAFFARLYNVPSRQLKDLVAEALNFVGLWEKRQQLPRSFSGGMKRRLNIACGIAHRPKLVIMDEPTVGIDPQSRQHILSSVLKLNLEGMAVLYTSHYMEEVEQLCTQVAIMDHGRVIALGSNDELKALIDCEEKIVIRLDKDIQDLTQIQQVRGVKESIQKEKELVVISEKNSHNLSKVLEAVTMASGGISYVSVEKPTLERVFLTLTGRNLRD